jgi:hypothetical protein
MTPCCELELALSIFARSSDLLFLSRVFRLVIDSAVGAGIETPQSAHGL